MLHTSEQVVKNYLRTTFDKLGVWTRLELALYVASHGGANWQAQIRTGLAVQAGWNAPSSAPSEERGRYPEAAPKVAAAASGSML